MLPIKPARLLLIEDDLLVVEYLLALLGHLGYHVAGHAVSGAGALHWLETAASPPDLIICDVRLSRPAPDGIQVIEAVRAYEAVAYGVRPPVPVLYLTAHSDAATTARAYATRPAGYLTKPYTDEQLRVAVALALHQAQGALAEGAAALPDLLPPSPREREVLRLLAQGLRTKEIAQQLHLSELTVQTHRRNLLYKYQVGNVAELIALGGRHGWLTSAPTGAEVEVPGSEPGKARPA